MNTNNKPVAATRTRFRHKLILFFMPLLLLFITGEIAGRLLAEYAGYMPRRAATYLSANPYLRGALVPGVEYRVGPTTISVNEHGFRGPEITVPKPEGVYRIFAIGESSTFGWKGVASHEEAWPALLEKKLGVLYPLRTIEVINAGVPGYTSVEQRVNFMLRISRLQPDAIVIYHGNNDINWSWVPEVETKLIYGRELMQPVSGLWNSIVNHSYVYLELRSMLNKLTTSSNPKQDAPDSDVLNMLKDNLGRLINDARAINVEVAIATFAHALDEKGVPGKFSDYEKELGVPAVGKWFDNLSPQGVRGSFPIYNQNVRELAAAEGVPLLDLAAKIPATPDYHTDWCHLTARGHDAVAGHWVSVIQQAGWLEYGISE